MVILGRMYFLDMDYLFVDTEFLVEDVHVVVVMDRVLVDEAPYPVSPAVPQDQKESCHSLGPGGHNLRDRDHRGLMY